MKHGNNGRNLKKKPRHYKRYLVDIPFKQTATLRFSKNVVVPLNLAPLLILSHHPLCSPTSAQCSSHTRSKKPFYPTREAPLVHMSEGITSCFTHFNWNISTLKLFNLLYFFPCSHIAYWLTFSKVDLSSSLEITEADDFLSDFPKGFIKLLKFILYLAQLWLVVSRGI